MSQPAIKVEGLWKEYTVGAAQQHNGTFYELLAHALTEPFNRLRKPGHQKKTSEQFWALRDVNIEIQQGEVLGVVGSNGAGKSTLLKILSRITAPTRGRIALRGRIASLLEVGTGFHPELSGRENIYLNATILGMDHQEISRKFDAIVAFSGVEKFLDTPVKRYSSGMYVRLAFAVAAHIDADILLIDEVLAVGDADFQKRCLSMMGDVARQGRTILFVSHNLTALRNLCTTGLLLKGGQPEVYGQIGDVLNRYASHRGSRNDTVVTLLDEHPAEPAFIRRISVSPAGLEKSAPLSVGAAVSICTLIELRQSNLEVGVFIHCYDANQNRVFSSGSFFNADLNGLKLSKGQHEFTCAIPKNLLNNGDYTLDVLLVHNRTKAFITESSILTFHVNDESMGVEGWNWPPVGVIRPKLEWSHEERAPSLHGKFSCQINA